MRSAQALAAARSAPSPAPSSYAGAGRRPRPRPAPLTVVLVLAIGLTVAYALTRANTGDMAVYRAGGQAVLHGGDLYDLRVGDFGFTYPPVAAALFATVAWLPLPAMFAVLTAASCAALYVVLRRSAPDVGQRLGAAVGLAALAATHPVVNTLSWGQVNLLLAALVLHDLLVRRSGVGVGLAAAVKLTPAVFVVYLVLCGRRREARTATATFLAASTLGAVVSPAASWRYWTHDVLAAPGVGGFDHVGNQALRGLAERALGTGAGTALWLLVAVPALVGGLLLARRTARAGDEVLAAGIAGLTACLVSPVAWIHHWVWCVPFLARVPVPVRLALGAGFVLPLTLGPVVGAGYPVLVLAALVGHRAWLPRMAGSAPR
ncbi:DUF2029 domain-containing protein [Nocardioides anomalus]|uniref:DUF2029 domain-containing protein n=1 Tax=Nocardioides anomalus TaxID=2712223 RepID=A0A6G6WAZ1_9ACTN|nr:glycosyltransferase 87 family protein [Nocardioides anomalus]QIG42511.1 DUF2029 domain-containing protein [Nocardioides anomalus]